MQYTQLPLAENEYLHIADSVGLDEETKWIFARFMLKRFPKERFASYALEWANRFKKGIEWSLSDHESRRVLVKLHQKYKELQDSEDIVDAL